MKRIKNLLPLVLAIVTLSGCDGLFGGRDDGEDGEVDPNLYTLELKVNMQGAEFQNIGLEYTPMTEDEMDDYVDEYGSKGITKENLQKVGTKDQQGRYYFMSQDGFYLKAPMVPGYEMTGWYDGDTKIDGGVDYTYDGKTDYKINMPAKNLVLTATYAPINYNFRMASHIDSEIVPSEMKTWNITMGDLVLDAPAIEGKTFKQWKFEGYYFSHKDNLINVEQGQELDPRCYKTIENVTKIDKDFLLQLGDVAYGYCADLETDLYAVYETQKLKVTINWTFGVDANYYIDFKDPGSYISYDPLEKHFIEQNFNDGVTGQPYSIDLPCIWGTTITITYKVVNSNYTFEGFFDGESNLLEENDAYTFEVKENKVINILVSFTPQMD